jgi:hypothetical protein
MPRPSIPDQPDDAGLLRYKYRRRESAVRSVALSLRLLSLALLLGCVALLADAAARNWAARRSTGPDSAVIGAWKGPRGEYHRDVAGKLAVALPLALMFAIPGFGLHRFQPAARHYGAALAVVLFLLSIFAIVTALTSPPSVVDPDEELENVPSAFYLGLIALGLGLPASAALFGFLRSHLIDPLFTREYRDAIRRTPPIPWPPFAYRLAIVAMVLAAGVAIGVNALDAARTAPAGWVIARSAPPP